LLIIYYEFIIFEKYFKHGNFIHMARNQNGIFGGFSGKIGNVVGCFRYGKYYLRSLPDKVHQPNTVKQLAQRMRFKLIQETLKPLNQFFRLGFGAYAVGRSAYSAAMSYNLEHALMGTYPDISIDYPMIRVSRGSLPGVANASMQLENDNSITFEWESIVGGSGAKNNDIAVILLFDPLKKHVQWFSNAGKRVDRHAKILLSETSGNTKLHGYLCFINERFLTGKILPENISDSFFCGILEKSEQKLL
jgi:hypothetical protein